MKIAAIVLGIVFVYFFGATLAGLLGQQVLEWEWDAGEYPGGATIVAIFWPIALPILTALCIVKHFALKGEEAGKQQAAADKLLRDEGVL